MQDLWPLLQNQDRWQGVFHAMSQASMTPYHHWDKLLHLAPPEGLDHEQWWLGLKLGRQSLRRPTPLVDRDGKHFGFATPDEVQELLHRIDQEASGQVSFAEAVTTPGLRDRYVVSSLIEEAITSSQLEGASTTRKVAKEMLRTGRPPKDRSEQMIANNYRAMRLVGDIKGQVLTPELVCGLHRIVTEGALDNPDAAGRLQRPEEERVNVYDEQAALLHRPPDAAELPQRLSAMCDFANGGTSSGFVHPVVRAVILHFWIGYEHYFEDGNGRTARAVFYWSLLSQGYWLAEFLTISSILKKAPSKYARSFLYTETDDNDLTYFVIYQLRVIQRAIEELQAYLRRKMNEVRSAESLLKHSMRLNHRQLALISHVIRNPDATYTIESHRSSHGVVYQTARSDLLEMVDLKLLEQGKIGRAFVFTPLADITQRLAAV